MATQTSELSKPMETVIAPEQTVEEVEVLQASIKAGSIAQVVVAVIAIIGLIYLLKFVLVTALICVLFAYVLEPPVKLLARLYIPRWIGALIVVVSTLAAFGSSNRRHSPDRRPWSPSLFLQPASCRRPALETCS